MAAGFRCDYDPADFYVWTPASGALTIHLSLSVVDRLDQECIRAARQKSGQQLAGVLLGYSVNAPHPATYIEDFVALEDVDDAGLPGSLRGDSLVQRLCALPGRLGLQQRPMGFFRWQRVGWLSLTDSDLEAANRAFSTSDNVVLLIRSSEYRGSEAAFFWREGGTIRSRDSEHDFPLDASILSQEHLSRAGQAPPVSRRLLIPSPNSEEEAPAPKPTPVQVIPKQLSTPAPVNARTIDWMRLLPTAALAMILTGYAVTALGPSHRSVTGSSALGLQVTSRSDQLTIQWNGKSSAVAAAKEGVIRISDGGETHTLGFSPEQLKDGTIIFQPTTRDVNVQLEVMSRDGGRTTESLRYLLPPPND